MNLGELERAVKRALQDRSLEEFYVAWINNAILELAADFELPALKVRTPVPLTTTTSDWLYDLPSDFHKNLFRCADSNYNEIRRYRTLDYLDGLDIDHDETGDHPTAVAWTEGGDDGSQIGIYPMADDTLYLWYYQKPTVLVKPTDIPTCIPTAYHSRAILPKAILKGFEHLQDQVENFDQKGLAYWQQKLMGGLRGSPVEGVGLIKYLSKIQGGSRRIGGKDPVGAGRWNR
jgi:hypothetical protein